MRHALIAILALMLPAAAGAAPVRLPSSGGEVILPTAGAVAAHDRMRYAAARRVGDTLYLSGVIVTRRPGEDNDEAALRMQLRRAFERMAITLAAADARWADVAEVTSFHVWDGPDFAGTRDAQFRIFSDMLGEYIAAPYPAWTAVGTTCTLGTGGIAEIELIVYLPDDAP